MTTSRTRQKLGIVARRAPITRRLIAQRDEFRSQAVRFEDERDQLRKANRRLAKLLEDMDSVQMPSDGIRSTRSTLGYIFIVTYGRTGSTLLQGILDSIPGYLIRGENRGALYHLFKFHQTCVKERKRVARSEALDSHHPWFGMDRYPRALALREIRALALDTIIRPLPDSRVVGFKEIRWQQKDLADYVAFLQSVFPGARFIFNTRDHSNVAKSKWWADNPNALAEIQRIETLQTAVAESLGDKAYRVHFDDYVNNPLSLHGLFKWLGEDFDQSAVQAVINEPHSY